MTASDGWTAVLFDLDGTLADTVELILRSFRHTMETHLGEVPPDERFLATIGTPLPVQISAFARSDEEALAMRETYRTFQLEVHDEMVRPFPGAEAVLRELTEAGVGISVVTSKASGIAERTLDRCGLLSFVDLLVCADQVENPKPHPESVQVALDHFGVASSPERVIFVGDSPFDMQAGRAAGTRTGAALWGPFSRAVLEVESPDFWFQELSGVLEAAP